jgi:hypothetical protein
VAQPQHNWWLAVVLLAVMEIHDRVMRLAEGLATAHANFSPHYDDLLREVSHRIDETGSAGKSDIAMLIAWKRLRADTKWVPRLLGMADAEVRAVTAPAVVLARGGTPRSSQRARDMLRALPGFASGTALASALLAAACPSRLAVYDRRAHAGLVKIGLDLDGRAPEFHERYMTLIDQCRAEGAAAGCQWSPHEVDLALFVVGDPTSA